MLQNMLGQTFLPEKFPSPSTLRLMATLRDVIKTTAQSLLDKSGDENIQSNIINVFQDEIRRMAGASQEEFGRSVSSSGTATMHTFDFGSPSAAFGSSVCVRGNT